MSSSYQPTRLHEEVKATCLKWQLDKKEEQYQVSCTLFDNGNKFDIFVEHEVDGFVRLEYKQDAKDEQNDFDSYVAVPSTVEGSSYYSFNESGYYSTRDSTGETQSIPASNLFEDSSNSDSDIYNEKEEDGFIYINMESSESTIEAPIHREDSGYFSCTKESQSLEEEPNGFMETSSQIKYLQEADELNAMKERHLKRYPFEAVILEYFSDNPEWLTEYLSLDFSLYMI